MEQEGKRSERPRRAAVVVEGLKQRSMTGRVTEGRESGRTTEEVEGLKQRNMIGRVTEDREPGRTTEVVV
jgi:hypothetical protein